MDTMRNNRRYRKVLHRDMKWMIAQYVVMCAFLSVMNYVLTPEYWWVLWVIAGWGLSLAMGLIAMYFDKEEDNVME